MSKYLGFKINPYKVNGTKPVYWVISKTKGGILGEIRWFYKWRQYCFYPGNSLFNKGCLQDIIDFLDELKK